MTFSFFVGIDVSKLTLDVFIHEKQAHRKFKNDRNGFEMLMSWVEKHTGRARESVLFCFEHTGLYSLPLAMFLEENSRTFSMISALEIKRSLGITRGKNDYVDSKRIADYSNRFQDRILPTKLPAKDITRLHSLLTLRTRLSTALGRYTASYKEALRFMGKDAIPELFTVYENMMIATKEQIRFLEKTIKDIIKENEALRRSYELATSVKGVGMVVACHLIAYTHNFTRFDSWRKFACYSGIAPFEHQSGTSVKGKTQVSSIANKQMKRLLHLAAICAIHTDAEMQEYYNRRQAGGKNKMTVINIVRNKILARIFAIIKRGTPFVDLRKYAA